MDRAFSLQNIAHHFGALQSLNSRLRRPLARAEQGERAPAHLANRAAVTSQVKQGDKLFFRARFMAEIAQVARRRALETSQAAALFAEADRALDRVILALITGHQA